MDKKNLMSQIAQPLNNLAIEDLPIEWLEPSEEVLSQVREGRMVYDVPAPWQLDPINPVIGEPITPVIGEPVIGEPINPVIGDPLIGEPINPVIGEPVIGEPIEPI